MCLITHFTINSSLPYSWSCSLACSLNNRIGFCLLFVFCTSCDISCCTANVLRCKTALRFPSVLVFSNFRHRAEDDVVKFYFLLPYLSVLLFGSTAVTIFGFAC